MYSKHYDTIPVEHITNIMSSIKQAIRVITKKRKSRVYNYILFWHEVLSYK